MYSYHGALKCNHEQLNQGCVPACLGGGLRCCNGSVYEISVGRNRCRCYLVQVL
jgi:hypothetical protein